MSNVNQVESLAQKSGLFEDDNHNLSMMRVIALVGIVLAALCVTAGIGLCFVESILKLGSANGITLSGVGFGIFTSGSLAKAWQKQSEAKAA